MDILDKILQLHQSLLCSDVPNKQHLEKQLDAMTCKYINECNNINHVSDIQNDLSSIETEIKGRNVSPTVNMKCNKRGFIKEAIISKVYSLSKLPIPFSPLFDRNKFNNFVINTRNEIISKMENDNQSIEELIDISTELDNNQLLFIKEEFIDLYRSYLNYFENIKTFTREQHILRKTIIDKIKNIDISIEELYYFKESFDKEISKYVIIMEKDMKILNGLVKELNIFTEVAQIIGLKKEHIDILHNYLLIKSNLSPNTDIINDKIIILKDLVPDIF